MAAAAGSTSTTSKGTLTFYFQDSDPVILVNKTPFLCSDTAEGKDWLTTVQSILMDGSKFNITTPTGGYEFIDPTDCVAVVSTKDSAERAETDTKITLIFKRCRFPITISAESDKFPSCKTTLTFYTKVLGAFSSTTATGGKPPYLVLEGGKETAVFNINMLRYCQY